MDGQLNFPTVKLGVTPEVMSTGDSCCCRPDARASSELGEEIFDQADSGFLEMVC